MVCVWVAPKKKDTRSGGKVHVRYDMMLQMCFCFGWFFVILVNHHGTNKSCSKTQEHNIFAMYHELLPTQVVHLFFFCEFLVVQKSGGRVWNPWIPKNAKMKGIGIPPFESQATETINLPFFIFTISQGDQVGNFFSQVPKNCHMENRWEKMGKSPNFYLVVATQIFFFFSPRTLGK